MPTTITLTLETALTEQQLEDLRYLLSDALGDFRAGRRPATHYVETRYPELTGAAFDAKVEQVERRCSMALRLHNTALNPTVTVTPDTDVTPNTEES